MADEPRRGDPRGPRTTADTPERDALALGLLTLAIYLATCTRDLSGDEIVFSLATEAWLLRPGLWWDFFHPFHPLFNPLVGACTWVIRHLGGTGFVADVGATVGSCFAGLAVAALTLLLRRRGLPRAAALWAAAVVALSGGLWRFGVRFEVYSSVAAAVVLWLAVLSAERVRPVTAGLALALAVLAHVATLALVPATALRLRRQPRDAALALVIGVGGPLGFILVVTGVIHEPSSLAAWKETLFPAWWGHTYLTRPSLLAPLVALRDLLTWRWYRQVPVVGPVVGLEILAAVALLIAVCVLAVGAWSAWRDTSQLGKMSLAGIASFLPLWVVWDVGNVEHTIMALPFFAVLLALGASRLGNRHGPLALGTLAGVLVVVNGVASAVPQALGRNGRVWSAAEFVVSEVPADAPILAVGGDSALRLGLVYLAGRNVVDLERLVGPPVERETAAPAALLRWLSAARSSPPAWAFAEVFSRQTAERVASLGIPRQSWERAIGSLVRGREVVLPPDGRVRDRELRFVEVFLRRPDRGREGGFE